MPATCTLQRRCSSVQQHDVLALAVTAGPNTFISATLLPFPTSPPVQPFVGPRYSQGPDPWRIIFDLVYFNHPGYNAATQNFTNVRRSGEQRISFAVLITKLCCCPGSLQMNRYHCISMFSLQMKKTPTTETQDY